MHIYIYKSTKVIYTYVFSYEKTRLGSMAFNGIYIYTDYICIVHIYIYTYLHIYRLCNVHIFTHPYTLFSSSSSANISIHTQIGAPI